MNFFRKNPPQGSRQQKQPDLDQVFVCMPEAEIHPEHCYTTVGSVLHMFGSFQEFDVYLFLLWIIVFDRAGLCIKLQYSFDN